MTIIFYNICSITIGLLLIYFGIFSIVKMKKVLFAILTFVHALLFIGFGIFGFCLPKEFEEYSFIVILAMLAFSITEILCFILLGKTEKGPEKK